MAKYRVVYKMVDYVYLDVEADSLEEAQEIAENADGVEFTAEGVSDLEYCYTKDADGDVIG